MTLLQIRNKYRISQALAASSVGIPLRTYIRYENDNDYGSSLKRESIIQKLMNEIEIKNDLSAVREFLFISYIGE